MEEDYENVLIILQSELENENEKRGQNSTDIKLPRVTIPKFEGDYFEWINFRDLFVALVLENKALSNSQRMQLLKTNLGGEAEILIYDLTLSNDDFITAWDRLKHRYENKKVIVH